MKKIVAASIFLIMILLVTQTAEARGRTGSRRVYHGHGKGSFYKGGR